MTVTDRLVFDMFFWLGSIGLGAVLFDYFDIGHSDLSWIKNQDALQQILGGSVGFVCFPILLMIFHRA